MTFKDLKKRVSTLDTTQDYNQLEQLSNKPFWIWDVEEHRLEDIKTKGICCFNHIIGLPVKGRIEKPIYNYEKLLYDSILADEHYNNILNHNFKHKHLLVKKATWLGVTELHRPLSTTRSF